LKICSECGLPLTYTKKFIEATWKFIVNNPFNRSDITSNTKKTKIEYELKNMFLLGHVFTLNFQFFVRRRIRFKVRFTTSEE